MENTENQTTLDTKELFPAIIEKEAEKLEAVIIPFFWDKDIYYFNAINSILKNTGTKVNNTETVKIENV